MALKTETKQDIEFVCKNLIAGGIAGMVSKTTVAPLDRIKILFQAHNRHHECHGIYSGLRHIIKTESPWAMYKGNGAQMVRIFPYAATQFTSFEIYKHYLDGVFGATSHIDKFLAGAGAGLTAVTLTYPLDTIRARLAFQISGEHVYTGIAHAAMTIFKEEGGARALYRGFIPTLMGMVPYAGLSFYCFEYLKYGCMKYLPNLTCKPCELNTGGLVLLMPAKLICGGLAGAVAQSVSYPLDVTRRRMQLALMNPNTKKFAKAKITARYLLAILSSIGLGIVYGLKVNLHVAIVSMVNHTANNLEANITDDISNNSTPSTEDGPFQWSTTIQGTLLSAYFWGYIVAQLPGGRIAELFSAKWVMFFAVFINIVCTLLTPAMAKLHFGALLLMRIGEGIGGGVTFPANHVMLAHWAPPQERSVMSSIVYAGTALGTVVFMLVTGLIAASLGWEAVFYLEGGISAIWLIFWIVFVADTPKQLRFISEEERQFIDKSLNSNGDHTKQHPKMPWFAALTSPPFLAILVAHTCSNWGWYMVLIELPQYMKNVLNFKISENAVLTALPFLCMWFFSIILSKILDTLRSKNIISTTMARKAATVIASLIPLICFIVLCYIESTQRVVAVVMMTIAVMSIGGMFCGFLSNHIDIAPNFAGTLIAITNTIATIPGIVVPVFVGKLTDHDPSIKSWRVIFWTTIVFYLIEILVYVIFASGDVQKWNEIPTDDQVEEQPLKSPQQHHNKGEKIDYESTK